MSRIEKKTFFLVTLLLDVNFYFVSFSPLVACLIIILSFLPSPVFLSFSLSIIQYKSISVSHECRMFFPSSKSKLCPTMFFRNWTDFKNLKVALYSFLVFPLVFLLHIILILFLLFFRFFFSVYFKFFFTLLLSRWRLRYRKSKNGPTFRRRI